MQIVVSMSQTQKAFKNFKGFYPFKIEFKNYFI